MIILCLSCGDNIDGYSEFFTCSIIRLISLNGRFMYIGVVMKQWLPECLIRPVTIPTLKP